MAKSQLAGALVALGFLEFIVVSVVNVHIEADISFLTLGGGVLIFIGVLMLSRELRFPPAARYSVLGCIVVAGVLGRAAGRADVDGLDDLRGLVYLAGAQSILTTVAVGIALGLRSGATTRVLAGVALLGNIAAIVVFLMAIDAAEAKTIDLDGFLLRLDLYAVLDNLMLVAATAFALAPPALPAGQLPVGANPFAGGPARPAGAAAAPWNALRPATPTAPIAPTGTPRSATVGLAARPSPASRPGAPGGAGATATAGHVPTGAGASRSAQVTAQVRRVACPRCQKPVTVAAGQKLACASCGYGK